MPVRCDTWNTTANRPDLVNLIGSKCRARERSVEGAPGPPDPWGLGGGHHGRSRFVCFKVSQTPQHRVQPTSGLD